MFISESSLRSVLASNPIIIFDTNIYLDLLRLSKNASTELLQLYQTIVDDLRIPEQVHKELEKNVPIISGKRIGILKGARTEIKNLINTCTTKVTTQLDIFLRHKFTDASTISVNANSEIEQVKKDIEKYIDDIIHSNDSFLDVSDVSSFVNNIWKSHVSEGYKPSKLMDIYRDGTIRYCYKIPPGYMDDPQNNSSSAKDGVDIFGDLVLWNQILDYGCFEHRPVIFVTADVKEDWFLLDNGCPKAPCNELIEEFYEKTSGIDICILTSDLFVQYLSSIKTVNTSEALLEMQMDDYTDITIRNYKDQIFQAFLSWGNDADNIYQFPFSQDVNTLLNISNIRYVVKGTSLQLLEKINYSVMIEGVADFSGVNYDKAMKCNTSQEVQASFQFDLRISFLRPYTKDASNNCIPLNEIENLQITNAILEASPSTDLVLESRRGTFILPTPQDEEIYEYMKSIWDGYSAENSVDRAEALVYFNAANNFQLSLLEINRSYTLVQNSKTKSMLSLNEIDALALKRFSDIKVEIQGEMAMYEKSVAPIGNAYPIPESMKLLPPEADGEVDVKFELNTELTVENSIVCTGTTTLPPKTQLLLTLRCPDQKYNAQSKVSVGDDRSFISEPFSNAHNPDGRMVQGKYFLEIVVPIVSVQPEEVKLVFGTKGRNLTGSYVNEDVIFGKTVRYEKEFII